MSWAEKKIGDLGTVVTGKTPPKKVSDYFDGDFLFVTPSDIGFNHYYCHETETTVTLRARDKLRNQFVPRDAVLFTCIGNTIGKCAIASAECLTNQQINAVVANDQHDAKFIYYLLIYRKDHVRGIGIGGGSAVPIINKSTFSNVLVRVPDLNCQKAMAEVLSEYDDLIENNNRRIELLEAAAQQLYKEWFVRFLFPGHEQTKIVNGLPQGWEVVPLEEVADIVMGQSPKSEFYNRDAEGLPFHQGVTNYGQRFVDHQTWCSKTTRIAESGDILFSVRAPVGRINITLDKVILGRGLAAIRSRSGSQSFLFYHLKQIFFKEDMIGEGSIYASISKKDLHGFELLMPPTALVNDYEERSVDIDRQIKTLHRSNQRLEQARDLLLPKLMSGEVKV